MIQSNPSYILKNILEIYVHTKFCMQTTTVLLFITEPKKEAQDTYVSHSKCTCTYYIIKSNII